MADPASVPLSPHALSPCSQALSQANPKNLLGETQFAWESQAKVSLGKGTAQAVLWTPAKFCGFPHRDVERGKAEISPLSTSAGGSPQPAAAQPTVGGGAPRRLYPAAGGLGRVCAKFRGETRAVRAAGAMGGGPAPAPLPRRRTDEQKELDHALLAHSM